MKSRALPILMQVCGLALSVLLVAQMVTMAVVLLWPPPMPVMTVPQAIAALRGGPGARMEGLRRGTSAQPPFPQDDRDRGVAMVLARQFGVPASDLRVRPYRWTERAWRDSRSPLTSLTIRDGRLDPAATGELTPQVLSALSVAYVDARLSLPAFEAALRTPDGWLTVGPDWKWLLRWRAGALALLASGLLVLSPLVWWVARRLTVPVRALAEAAGRVGQWETEPVRFPATGPREVVAVAEALDAMQARLAEQMEQRTRMLLAVAHDLRTPLTGLRLRIEMLAAPEEREAMVGDVRRIERMIEEVMRYSDASRQDEPATPLDLRACVAEVVRSGGHSDRIGVPAGPSPVAMAGALRCARVVGNLLDNAVKYASTAEVRLAIEADTAVLRIADSGPGIPERTLEAVFEPFYRGEGSRNRDTGGIGLGLAIARACAARDGGCIRLANRPGGGLVATLVLPLAKDAAGQ